MSSSASYSVGSHPISRRDSTPHSPASTYASSASLSSLPDCFSSSASSSTGSFPPFSSCPSPSSSLASSPALKPTTSFLPILEDLHLDNRQPTQTEVAAYAAATIRNEAYALLALASRIAPAGSQIVGDADDYAARFSAETSEHLDRPHSDSGSEGAGSPEFDFDHLGSPQPEARREESRTNAAFTQVIRSLSSLPPHGKILVTGVGKSGIAGQKMVATFNSLGVPAVFLHPLEALHGDLGVICPCSPHSPCDALIMISHSGATAELMRLLPIVRPRVRHLVAVTRDPDSVLARACGGWLDAGTGSFGTKGGAKETDEADSALPAPTSSVVCALAVGDAVALSLSRLRIGWGKGGKERRADFLRCHPGGQLGINLGREGRGVIEPNPGLAPAPAASA